MKKKKQRYAKSVLLCRRQWQYGGSFLLQNKDNNFQSFEGF